MLEIEKKWRLERLSKIVKNVQKTEILQGYIFTEPGELRVRKFGKNYYITVKGESGLSRLEWESQIPEWTFNYLWLQTKGKTIVKERYRVPYNEYFLEVDDYKDHLLGLILLECEFPDIQTANNFELPEYIGYAVEVTNDRRYSNKNLSIKGIPETL